MRTLVLSALALGALTSAALAEPVVLADAQLDAVTAGQAVLLGPPEDPTDVIRVPGAPVHVHPGEQLADFDRAELHGQPGQGGFIVVPGAPFTVDPGLPSDR